MVDRNEEKPNVMLEQWLIDAAPKADPEFQRQLRAQSLNELKQEEPTMAVRNWDNVWRLAGAALALASLYF